MLTRTTARSKVQRTKDCELPIAHVEDLSETERFFKDGLDGVIWQRTIPTTLSEWLRDIPASRLPEGRFVLNPTDVKDCILDVFHHHEHLTVPKLSWLCDDVARLAKEVRHLAGQPWIRMRLEAISDNACSKFHVDNIITRMICTYRGPGSQLSTVVNREDQIAEIQTGQPILLKGKQWQQSSEIALRHRSPPIAGTGQTRWLVVLEGCERSELMPEYDEIYRDLNL